jgi:hypothetical protein
VPGTFEYDTIVIRGSVAVLGSVPASQINVLIVKTATVAWRVLL